MVVVPYSGGGALLHVNRPPMHNSNVRQPEFPVRIHDEISFLHCRVLRCTPEYILGRTSTGLGMPIHAISHPPLPLSFFVPPRCTAEADREEDLGGDNTIVKLKQQSERLIERTLAAAGINGCGSGCMTLWRLFWVRSDRHALCHAVRPLCRSCMCHGRHNCTKSASGSQVSVCTVF